MADNTVQRSRSMHPLARHRKAAGFTLVQWAKALDLSVNAVWSWEHGKAEPAPDKYPKIAELLGITPLEVTELVCPSQPTAA